MRVATAASRSYDQGTHAPPAVRAVVPSFDHPAMSDANRVCSTVLADDTQYQYRAPSLSCSPVVRLAAPLLLLAGLASPTLAQSADERLRTDWASLQRYRQANADLPPVSPGASRVVFYGNSITDGWATYFGVMFPGKPYVGRGISGQTTPQMLVRFRQDVVALSPKVVVILAGINDIAGNTGPSTLTMIEDNFESMTEIARANGIRVVLSSVLPAFSFPWRPGVEPAATIIALNAWLKAYAATHDAIYLDYHSAMADDRGGLPPSLSEDGVHPNEAGYRVMAPLAEKAIAQALGVQR